MVVLFVFHLFETLILFPLRENKKKLKQSFNECESLNSSKGTFPHCVFCCNSNINFFLWFSGQSILQTTNQTQSTVQSIISILYFYQNIQFWSFISSRNPISRGVIRWTQINNHKCSYEQYSDTRPFKSGRKDSSRTKCHSRFNFPTLTWTLFQFFWEMQSQ